MNLALGIAKNNNEVREEAMVDSKDYRVQSIFAQAERDEELMASGKNSI